MSVLPAASISEQGLRSRAVKRGNDPFLAPQPPRAAQRSDKENPEFSPFLRPVTGAIIDRVKQMENRQLDSVAGEQAPRGGRPAFELWSGKVPLRPIQRIGILLLNGIPLLFLILFGARGISALKGAPTLVQCVFLPIILLWAMITLAMGRWVWAALTAPSQRDE